MEEEEIEIMKEVKSGQDIRYFIFNYNYNVS